MNNNIIDNSENLTNIIKKAREKKKYSQRKLARICEVSHTEIIKIESGERKRPDVDILGKIAGALDIGLIQLLKLAGYENFIGLISLNSKDRFADKSIYDLKDKIIEYEKSESDLLSDISERRKKVNSGRQKINHVVDCLENPDLYQKELNNEEIKKWLKEADEELKEAIKKYDNSKLPERISYDLFEKRE